MKIGYARVSTLDQNLDLHLPSIFINGIDCMYLSYSLS